MQRFAIILLLGILACAPSFARAAEDAGFQTGFVDRSIWYSKASPEDGDRIFIYAAIFNARPETLSGTVSFYDGETLLGKKVFSVPGYNVATVSTDWKAAAGKHTLRAMITDPVITVSGKQEPVFLETSKTPTSTITVKQPIVPAGGAEKETTVSEGPVTKITDSISEHIPESVSAPVASAATGIDGWRATTGATLAKQEEAKRASIDANDEPIATATIGKDGTKITPAANALKTPLAYAGLFFFTALAYVFNHPLLFYTLVALILILIIRFIWRRFSDR